MSTIETWQQFTPQLNRYVDLRPETSDHQTWIDTFEIGYHVPPPIHPDAVLDLGANVGLTASHYRMLWPHIPILAVEMDAGNAAMCERNFGDVVNCAVGPVSGEATYMKAEWNWHASYSLTRPGEVTVRVLTISDLLDDFLPDCHFVFCKMDVEGTEWEVMDDVDDRIHWLLVELHHGEADEMVARASGMLLDAGFAVTRHAIHPHAVWAER